MTLRSDFWRGESLILHASSPLGILSCNRSRGYNARFITTYRAVSVYRVLQMRGGGYADVLPVLQVPDNKADAVLCERLR